jgi:hypothetical protein
MKREFMCKIMSCGKNAEQVHDIKTRSESFERVAEFRYLAQAWQSKLQIRISTSAHGETAVGPINVKWAGNTISFLECIYITQIVTIYTNM